MPISTYFTVYFFFAEQEKILNLHPDLAGKIHQLKTLTYESQREQISAGLDQISVEDAEELNALNEQC